jgi:deoxyguanosine kinase
LSTSTSSEGPSSSQTAASTAQHPYIAIDGVIGVGKTTLARLLQSRFKGQTVLEAFDENPFLSDFYGDRARYAFQTQLFFLLSRYRQQQRAAELLTGGALLADYCFPKDRLFAHLNIQSVDELEMYDRLYAALAEKVRPPDLVVYLRARVDTLMARIAMRDRTYERQMDRSYIAALHREYDALFADYDATPSLIIETDDIDFVRNPGDLDDIEHRIRSALAGTRQPTLPKISFPVPARPAWRLVPAQKAEPRSEANWQALGDFLALAEAVGKIGGSLSQQAPLGPEGAPGSVCDALHDANRALLALAQRIGVRLESLP